MSNYNFNYSFNISGNCNAVVQEIAENVGNLRTNLTQTEGMLLGISDILELIDPLGIFGDDGGEYKISVALNQFTDYLGNLRNSFAETMAPGAALNASLADLAAISGATGKELDTVEKFARRTAREFGGSAAGAVESYKLLLSQLSPELTKNTEALDAMGRNVAILSKTMGGDTTAAAEVLTTAMNQYGVSLKDPMEASRQMADMMNIMAAAGREGSAELPTIKVALEQCGMAAKAAGVSFAETNAAIQVLDKAGKKGSEGGVALRNVMATLAQGRFLPKDVQQELAAAGREGSAELPTIKVALEQCGMAAKAAGVSFAETNAAIQVLDKAGKKGSEGGVALRNVMATLAQGRFLPKDVQQELAAAGVIINDLTDQSKTLAERLTILKPVMAATVIKEKRNRGKKFSISTNLHLSKIAGAETGRRDAESFYEKNPTHSALQSVIEVSRIFALLRESMLGGCRDTYSQHNRNFNIYDSYLFNELSTNSGLGTNLSILESDKLDRIVELRKDRKYERKSQNQIVINKIIERVELKKEVTEDEIYRIRSDVMEEIEEALKRALLESGNVIDY